jgi:acetyl esterase/lipase
MKKQSWIAALVAAMLLAAGAYFWLLPELAYTRDVVYGHAGGVDLKLDLAVPMQGDGPFPAVVCIHGGAWQAGKKEDMEFFARHLADHGYVAATVSYRLAPAHLWPAQIEDVKCAVRYLRAHAKELNIDPANIFATGASAGGHLSLMLGLMDPKDGLEGAGGHAEFPSTVRGVANFFGPTEFKVWTAAGETDAAKPEDKKSQAQQILEAWLGTSDRSSGVVRQASPITYVRAGNPPILTFQGTTDEIVPASQATLLHEALEQAGVQQKLVLMEGEGHGWGGEKMDGSMQETVTFFEGIRQGN